MKTEFKFLLIIIILLWPGASLAEEEYPFWQLVAKSVLIVEGKIDVPVAAIQKAEQNGDHDFVEVKVDVSKTLKGKLETQSFNFRYYTDTEQYQGVSRKQIISLHGKSAIVFLQNVKEKYYLAAYAPETLQSASAALTDRVQQEAGSQEKLIHESDSYAKGHVLPRESEVQSLVELMVDRRTDPTTAQAVYEAVIALGKKAVPTLIKYMDDRRKLNIPKITLAPWWPDAQEGLVHYGPETVTDVLSIALMALTNEDLTAIYNGGTELERAEAVRIWKIYERRTFGKPVTR
ncbi:MAG: hypothetical protein OEM27_05160 [Nitrospinota bacterium]|nr:hypothetical protein [Nitrospinota bacterium]